MTTGHVLITGGAGFIGSNVANRLLDLGRPVILFDDLSRGHVHRNVQWLKRRHGDEALLRIGDVGSPEVLAEVLEGAVAVVHLAARTSVRASVEAPVADFDVNARGTMQLIDAVRRMADPPLIVHASTSEVYGRLDDVALASSSDRWTPVDDHLAAHGVDEQRPLRFATPHGCSKGAADQVVLEAARAWDLPTIVLRLGSIYGPRQFGDEDESFVAHALVRARRGAPIDLPGDGRDVRDLLYVDDLVDAITLALDTPDPLVGRAFNVGGGPGLTASRLEIVRRIEEILGRRLDVRLRGGPASEPRWYASDPRAFEAVTGWTPRTTLIEGLRRLDQWLSQLDRNAPPTMVLRRRRVPAAAMERT
jgi:CDP-paratose 2-epimerase